MSPARQRDAVRHVQQVCEVSERRACQTLSVARSTFRYESVVPDDHELIALLAKLRVEFPTWGYRKLTGVLKERGHLVNHKRVYRIWKAQGWQRPRPQKKQDKPRGEKANACHVRRAAEGVNENETGASQKLKFIEGPREHSARHQWSSNSRQVG